MVRRAGTACRRPAGQATMEYAIFIGVCAAVFLAMSVYTRRWVQGCVKVAADQMSPDPGNPELGQLEGIRRDTGDERDPAGNLRVTVGTMVSSQSVSQSDEDQVTGSLEWGGGARTTDYRLGQTIVTGTATTGSVTKVNN